ncbi:MAG: efflux RND transporter periplasmic adaptor subunit [Gemmatimonadetes bacterium]|nr:efflux RND transporter periplasmic adaptor subunit [Gemmatimonadota bacterium]
MNRSVRHSTDRGGRPYMRLAIVLLALLAACDRETGPGAEGPAPIDHSEHQAGSGEVTDSTGAVAREPVSLTPAQERALGVVYMQVTRSPLETIVRTVGRIEASEARVSDVTPKIDGFVERLHVATTGETVTRGQSLLTLYSPELVAAQEELLTALRLRDRLAAEAGPARDDADRLVQAARRRLAWWDITDRQVERVIESGEATKTLTLVAPVSGVVLEKTVIEGQRVRSGDRLYRIADLSEVWVEGDVFEQDIRFVRERSVAHIEVAAYPGRHFMGSVAFVYPTVDRGSRTNRVRISLANPGLALKPGMFATIYFDVEIDDDAIVVPLEAVVVTGERNLVFVRDPDGTLRPQEVVLGPQGSGRVEILEGLVPGEEIVTSANFLVDAESRLAATGGGMPGMQHGAHEVPQAGSVPEAAPEPAAPSEEHRHD